MKVLLIGSGGREHALVWKLRQSPRVSKVYCAPGNGGIADEAECLPADIKNLESLLAVAHQVQPDLTIVGPELPLMMGVVDEFTRRGWRTFGPTKAAARLETSKSFAKEFLQRHHIPTAHYAICNTLDDIHEALPHFHTPIVVKADGLAAGKGVVLCKSKEEAASVATEMLSGRMLGEAGSRVVLEEYMRMRRTGRGTETPLRGLTQREREIFELAVRGLSNQDIASQLCISKRTVETHRGRIMRKLHVHSATDLVRLAARHGLLDA